MKKFTIIGLAICLAFALAAPVMAVDVDFSGNYHVRGAYTSHWNLDKTSASNAYMDMRFRLQTVFKASDILSVTARFDALDDHVWGKTDDPVTAGAAGNVTFKRAYMTIKAPIGTFDIGRIKSGVWGINFIDSESQADRIKYTKVIDNLTVMAVFEKTTEGDDGLTATDDGDVDSDKYALAAIQKMENITAGLQLIFVNDKNTGSSATDTDESIIRKYTATPYFVGKFGPLGIQGELAYTWGEKDFDEAATTDIDYKTLAYNIEASYNVGPASIMAGYAFLSGDGNGTGTDHEDSAAGSVGNDWGKLFILTTSDVGALVGLGGVGNLSKDGIAYSDTTFAGSKNDWGAKIIYGGVTFSPLDNLELGVVVGKADADDLEAGKSKDDYGTEYDFTLNWEIYDNLTYNAVAAFLKAGDFYKEQASIAEVNFDDTYALFHQLELSF